MQKEEKIQKAFKLLLNKFGPQHWWPGDTPFEVMVGAILTQQTSWKNVEKAIERLKEEKLLSPLQLYSLPEKELVIFIKPAGFYNVKAKRLKSFINYFIKKFHGNINEMEKENLWELREELLSIHGIGRETADSILLYALNKQIFVVDAYTKRIIYRMGISDSSDYEDIRRTFEGALNNSKFLSLLSQTCPVKRSDAVYAFQEMHALLVAEGKNFCKKKPVCAGCPIRNICERKRVL